VRMIRLSRLVFVVALVTVAFPAAGMAESSGGRVSDGPGCPTGGRVCLRAHSKLDFRVATERLDRLRYGRRSAIRVRVWNIRKWTATTVRVCARVPRKRARVVSVNGRGSIRYKGKSACWIVRRIKPKHSVVRLFDVSLRRRASRKGLTKIAVTVTAGNSNPLSHSFALVAAPHRHRHSHGSRRPGSGASSSSTCVPPNSLGIVFVTDVSESMEISDPTFLRSRAISVGLDQLPDGSIAAGTVFDEYTSELFGATTVDASTRPGLKQAAQQLYDYGGTDYQEAFLGAQEELNAMPGADKKAVVFLSDGAPNFLDFDANEAIAAAGIPIYTIGLGVDGFPEAEGILAGIAAGSGGQFYDATAAGQLQAIFGSIVSSLTCGAPNVIESFSLAPGESRSVPFSVESSDSEFRGLVTWSEGDISVSAQRPDGTMMTPGTLLGGEGFVSEPTYALLTGTNPLIGQWQITVTAAQGNVGNVDISVNVFRHSLAEPPPPPPAPGRHLDPCATAYPKFKSTTRKALGGKRTVYNRAASLDLVCGGFGAPEDLKLTPEMECALVAAAATFGGPPLGVNASRACDALAYADAFRTGNWLGAVAGQACGYFSDVFAGGVGTVAAGATAETGPGAVAIGLFTYRALAAGLKIACGGLLDGGAKALGVKLEADHETHIALDVTRKGRCIQLREVVHQLQWSAVACK